MRQETQSWNSQETAKQIEAGKLSEEIKADVRVSVVKPLHAKWIVNFYDCARSKPQLIKHGRKESSILTRFHEKINLDPFT